MKQNSEIEFDCEQNQTKSKLVLIISVLILAALAVTAFFTKIIIHSVEKTSSPEYNSPTDYTGLEGADAEERVLFEGFRTSFLPDEELMLCQFHSKSKREVSSDNDTSDIMFLWDFPEDVTDSTRLKRKSNSTLENDASGPHSANGEKKKQNSSKSEDPDNVKFGNDHKEDEEVNDDDDYYEEEGYYYGDNYQDYEEQDDPNYVITKDEIGRKENNASNSRSKGDVDYGKGDIVEVYDGDVEGGSEYKAKNTNSIDEEDEDNVKRRGGEENNETHSIDDKDKENVEGYFKNNKKTNCLDEDNVDGERENKKSISIRKDYFDNVIGDNGKAVNKTNSISKEDADLVEVDESSVYEGGSRKNNNETKFKGKENVNYVEGDGKKKNNETNFKGKEHDNVKEIVRKENSKTNSLSEKDEEDYIEDYKDDGEYNEPDDNQYYEKSMDNEIERGSGDDYYPEKEKEDYDEPDDQPQNKENEGIESIVRPQTHVDRGPLDDVVEQVRGQPELEEGEMASSAHLYKPAKPHLGLHALFKGQGDKNTIRATQANIMRRNMDPEADPCQDFYQYACGNWAALNPIPADKAGYDTFEMLRENLDSILKDLLEFSKDEQITSKYPGPYLDIKDNLLKGINYQNPITNEHRQTTIKVQSREVLKGANVGKYRYYWKKPEQEKSEIIKRIRHILNRKPRATLKQLKAQHAKIFYSKIRQPYQRHRRRLKQKRLIQQSFKYYPRRKFTLKRSNVNPDTVFRRRKIQAIKDKRKSRLKREVDHDKPGTPSNNGDAALGDAAMKARFLFKSCMNYGILQKRGHQPLLDLLNLLGGWPILDPTWDKTDFDWLELMAKLRLYNNDILISEWVGPDIKNSDEFVIQFDQTSLGLPTREYFLQDSNKVYLNAYKNYLIKVALLLGGDKQYVEESAEKLIDFEIKLAKITSAPEDRRNVSELYRRMTLQKLENMVPQVKWRRYLCVVMNRTVRSNETVVLFALNYVRHLVTLIDETDSSILSNYLLWRFVRHRVNNLDDRFQSAKQQFYFILFGREQAPPRWKNCISQVNSNMGMALGSMFVKKYFDETSKNDTLTMTREIQQSFRELLHRINWIDDETKKLAAHKVDAMMLRIGYPDFILNKNQLNERYKAVRIHPDKYFENILNILQHLTQMEQSRIGQPVNKTLWNTAPAVVNAYYSRNKNQIMFPAGILQPPFYHRHFPRSLNYGGIGVVIGHEITHGFDDKGRLFDCNGNLHRWWSDTAIESFHRRAQCLIDQYGQYVVPEVSMKLDGVNTQGENIADNGGVKQAFRAYRHWVQQHGTEGETLPGLNHTHTQLFFLNFAQVWCGAMRPEAMRNKLKTAVHSPGRFRVIGTLSNSVDFAREFKCPPGTPMNPTDKCTVW